LYSGHKPTVNQTTIDRGCHSRKFMDLFPLSQRIHTCSRIGRVLTITVFVRHINGSAAVLGGFCRQEAGAAAA
ncbi:MAG: hypothetical protein ACRD2G_01845, partial [Terriglobia bacterium]